MSQHNYTRAVTSGFWNINLNILSPEVQTALPGKAFTASANGVNVVFDFTDTLTAGEITTLDTAVSDHQAAYNGERHTLKITLANEGASDVTLVDTSDSRLSDARTPTTHTVSHTNGSDDIQSATSSQKGLATAAQITKLDGIEALADVTDATNVAAAGAVMDSDISAGEGFLRKTGAGVYEGIKSNLTATAAPGSGNDNTQGYSVGSIWADQTNDKVWTAIDVSTGAAVWVDQGAGATGPAGLDWIGAWVTSTSYAVDDAVENDGSSYICTSGHTSSASDEPGVGGSWASYWDLLAQAGGATAHNLGGSEHSADTLANLNAKVSDATLIDTADSRLSDERTANAIATTGADVNVDAAAPPTTGQVLKATSATTATWQDAAGASVFGTEWQHAEDESVDSTTLASNPGAQALRLTTSSLPAGDYRIGWSLQQAPDKATVGVAFQVELDDTTELISVSQVLNSASSYYPVSGHQIVTLGAGVHTIDVDHWTESGAGGGSNVKNVRLELWRVA
jgi:hypothetical protein